MIRRPPRSTLSSSSAASDVYKRQVVYVLVNLLFFELLCTKLGWFRKYRLARKQYQVPSASLMNQTLSEASIGQLAISPFLLYLSFPLLEQLGVPACDSELPSVAVLWWQFGVAHLFNDVFFYWSHRIVHVTAIYPLIHKKHHTYTGTIGMAAEYAHPIEQLLANTFPTVGGVLLFGRHPLVLVMWLGQRLQQTYESHSGYCFYGSWVHGIGLTNSHSTAWHDYHHTGNQGNFGAAWLDWLCGTMDHFCELGMAEGYIEHCRRQASKSG
eukprot:TRINITY_DN1282_c0_g1_i1.p1 TRINITY_DN1282_c0_g1~~TRINITY_DN1282_c0_g1_i1.p1  ORF type:complete len:269 (+),score=50.70 TRINITY_DN1282_c0_g1_i1:138-944(+)